MKRGTAMCVLVCLALAGCGRGEATTAPAERPLTLSDWNAMPASEKYRAESYERLKLGEPKFRDEKNWDPFYRKTVLPGRKKDLGESRP